jgi:hypothetical protein
MGSGLIQARVPLSILREIDGMTLKKIGGDGPSLRQITQLNIHAKLIRILRSASQICAFEKNRKIKILANRMICWQVVQASNLCPIA